MFIRVAVCGVAALFSGGPIGPGAAGGIKDGDQGAMQACPHGIEAARCPFCTPTLIETLGQCAEHGVAEALCVACRPYLAEAFKAAGDWCREHDTPESQCVTCHPNLGAGLAEGPIADPVVTGADTPQSQRPPDRRCTKTDMVIRLGSPEIARTVDLGFAQAKVEAVAPPVERNAEMAYNGNGYAHLSSRAPGVVAEVARDLGEAVAKGDVLAVVDSVDLGAAKAEVLLGLETVNLWQATAAQQRSLVERGAGIERDALESETRLAESRIALSRARQRLRSLGLSAEQVERVEREGDTSSLLELLAPFDGVVVERDAVVGELVDPGSPLMAVADVGVMWAMIDLHEADAASVRAGQAVRVALDGLPGEEFSGRLGWVSTQLDPRTRALKARAELDNGSGLLRAYMFGRARIFARADGRAVTVPREAVQWEGCCNVVFVRTDEAGLEFRPVKVRLGGQAAGLYEVLGGLKGGETVATTGSYLLKTEILKGSIGAGCCEVEHLDK